MKLGDVAVNNAPLDEDVGAPVTGEPPETHAVPAVISVHSKKVTVPVGATPLTPVTVTLSELVPPRVIELDVGVEAIAGVAGVTGVAGVI